MGSGPTTVPSGRGSTRVVMIEPAPRLRPLSPPRRVWSRWVRTACALVLLLEVARLTAFALAGPVTRAMDAAGYWHLGTQVARGDVWMTEQPVAFRTPGYPWVLGTMQAVFRENAWAAAVGLQYLAVAATTLVVGTMAWRLTDRPWCVVAAMGICVVSGARAGFASVLLTESLFTLCLTAFGGLIAEPAALSKTRSTLLVAAVWCAAWLLRPVAIALLPAWGVAWWFSRGHRLRAAGLTVLVLAIGLGPWIVRNTILWHRPMLTAFAGRELWLAVYGPGQPVAPPLPDTPAVRELTALITEAGEFSDWHANWYVSHRLTDAGLTDVEADELMKRAAWEGVRAHPLRFSQRVVWRMVDFWRAMYLRSFADYDGHADVADGQRTWSVAACREFRHRWLEFAPERVLLVIELSSFLGLVGLAGLWLSPATARLAAIQTALIACVWLTTAALEHPAYRYRMVLDPLLIVCGLAGWQVWSLVVAKGRAALRAETS
jgi:hypothetical protein